LPPTPHVAVTTGCNQGTTVSTWWSKERHAVSPTAPRSSRSRPGATKWDGSWQYEASDEGFRHAPPGQPEEAEGVAHVVAVEPAKVLTFGKRPCSHTRYVPARQ
jgi:hypothetical protein